MRFGSVCSGIEAASVAFEPLGWKAAWFSEIEKFPCAVLAHHYPNVPNYGDMTQIPKLMSLGLMEAPDILCGGTPCQAFSVAGKRESLNDTRGNLSLTFCEIADAIDNKRKSTGLDASVIFWENVPGVLNTSDNAFGCFLGQLAGESEELQPAGKKWSNAGCVFGPQRTVAWRVLDAQYFGVAQRRRRVFVVASARDGFDPAAVLFEFEGMCRDSPPSREAGQTTAYATAPCLTSSGRGVERTGDTRGQDSVIAVAFGGNNQSGSIDLATARNACASASGRMDFESETFLVQSFGAFFAGQGAKAGSIAYSDTIAPTLKASDSGTNRTPSAHIGMQVRRLTPVECERLQGFPDNYTDIQANGKPTPDGPRYKALGNSWAVPCVRWIGKRIAEQLNANP